MASNYQFSNQSVRSDISFSGLVDTDSPAKVEFVTVDQISLALHKMEFQRKRQICVNLKYGYVELY